MLLEKEFGPLARPCVKDPRICRLLPLWQQALERLGWQAQYLVVFRHPGSVAASLAHRNGIPPNEGLALWLSYTLSLLKSLPNEGVAFVYYDDFLDDPAAILSERLDRLFPAESLLPDTVGLKNFVDRSLCHHWTEHARNGDADMIRQLSVEIFDFLKFLAAGRTQWKSQEIADFVSRFRSLETAGKAWGRSALIADFGSRISYLEAELQDSNNRCQELRRELNNQLQELNARQQELNAKQQELNAKQQELNAKQQELNAKQQELNAKQQELNAKQRQLDEIYSSRSWKVARVLSRAWRALPKPEQLQELIFRLAKRAYHRLPLNMRTKNRLRSVLQRAFPVLNRARGGSGNQSGNVATGLGAQIRELESAVDALALDDLDFRPREANPLVSLIVPVHNNLDYTVRCLKSIYRSGSDIDYEVILVDDLSGDNTPKVVQKITGLVYVRNRENLGFLRSCNLGARKAKGRYLVFLNNDTLVFPGWLSALLEPFQRDDKVGLVGAKLIFPDGRLQEAGGIVWRDGSAWNFGRLEDPEAPEYNYLRQVDYLSAACICVPKILFDQLGGFDERFTPAYYEDTDLAFSVRKKGFKVLYQPRCRVVHYEGVSCGADLGQGVKRYQLINAEKFRDKWRDVLKHHSPNGHFPEREKDRYCRARVLVVDALVPTPDRDSGSLRMFNILKILVEMGCKVTFVPENLQYLGGYVETLQEMGIEVLYAPYVCHLGSYMERTRGLYDVVVLSRPYVAGLWMDTARKNYPDATLIYDTVDLHFLRERRQAEVEQNHRLFRQAEETEVLETGLMRKADTTWVVSPYEQDLLRGRYPKLRVEVLSNVHEVFGRARPFEDRRDILFVGGFNHPPNVDAVRFFVSEIWPGIREDNPGLKFYVVGSDVPDEIRSLADDTIIVTGYVEDLAPYFNRCLMSVAPLRYGAGVKGKINMSMSYGVPVVATSVGVEGMSLEHGVDVLVGDSPDEFARLVTRLCRDKELWNRLSDNGMRNLQKHFSFDAARTVLEKILTN
ncbi:GT2 family glycosyltransferase [Geothermobacter ehrlichii]|uniref:GT2 family glycosyltransferase n=2 Tax=Geothermobacter ehrlichii TaxID=213224 RepID=A0A5D3WM54_9BACT|nr:GT2 family glycosyltransferase [Geothermobacter ehrlichii]